VNTEPVCLMNSTTCNDVKNQYFISGTGYAFRNCKHEVVRGTLFPTTASLLENEFQISWYIVEPGDLIILGPGWYN